MKTLKTLLLAAVLSAAFPPRPVSAADAGDESIYFDEIPSVITASLKRQQLDEVPGTMTVITDDDIKAHGLQTLGQALDLIPGFHMTQASYAPVMTPVIRGYVVATGHLKVMIDGHAVNGTSHREIDVWQDMPLDEVKQIEVIRGPGSSLYGTDALLATVNVITRKERGAAVSATAGTLGRWGTNVAAASDPKRTLRYRASFNQFGEQGSDYLYRRDYFSGTAFDAQSLAPIERTKPNRRFDAGAAVEYGGLSVVFRHGEDRKGWSEGNLGIQTPARSFITARSSFWEARYRHAFTPDTALSFRGSYDDDFLAYTGQILPPNFDWSGGLALPGFVFGPEGALYRNWQNTQRYEGQALFETVAGDHSLTAGFEYGYQYIPESRSRRNYDQTMFPLASGMTEFSGQHPQNASLAEHASEEHWGAFAQDVLSVRPFSFILGARYDQYQLAGHAFSPRVAVVWDAPWNQILKASFGKAFLGPSTDQRYYNVAGFTGNPRQRPAIVTTYEVSAQNAYAARAHYVLTWFNSSITDGFAFDVTQVPTVSNAAAYRFTGVEFDGRWEAFSRLGLWGNVSYCDGRDKRSSTSAAFNPRVVGNAGVVLKPAQALSASVYVHFAGPFGRTMTQGRVPGSGRLDGAVNWDVSPSFSLQLSGQNLLDQEIYADNLVGFFPLMGGSVHANGLDWPMPGRQVFLKASWRI